MCTYRFASVVALITAISVFLAWRNPARTAKPWQETPILAFTNLFQNATNSSTTTRPLQPSLEKAFDYQLKSYQQSLGTLETNLFMQAAFVIFGLLVLFSTDEYFEVPVIKLRLQRSWLHFIVPLALLFLWLRFGFLLDGLIKTRVYGWEILKQMSTDMTPQHFRSAAALFEDAGFMDGWFLLYRTEHVIDPEFINGIKVIFPFLFGVLLGMTHACILATSQIGNARFIALLPQRRNALRTMLLVLPWLMFAVLILSHRQFFYGGHNPNWLQSVVSAVAVMGVFVLTFLSRRVEKQPPQDSPLPSCPH